MAADLQAARPGAQVPPLVERRDGHAEVISDALGGEQLLHTSHPIALVALVQRILLALSCTFMKFTARWDLGSVPQRVGKTTALPRRFTARWEYPTDHTVEMDIEVLEGIPVCQAIRIERNPACPPLSGTELRRMPITNWLEFACANVGLKIVGAGVLEPLADDDEAAAEEIMATTHQRAVRQRQKIDRAFLRDVVASWREVERDPRAAAEVLRVSVSQLHRYLQRARDVGLAPEYGRKDES